MTSSAIVFIITSQTEKPVPGVADYVNISLTRGPFFQPPSVVVHAIMSAKVTDRTSDTGLIVLNGLVREAAIM